MLWVRLGLFCYRLIGIDWYRWKLEFGVLEGVADDKSIQYGGFMTSPDPSHSFDFGPANHAEHTTEGGLHFLSGHYQDRGSGPKIPAKWHGTGAYHVAFIPETWY